MAILLPTAPARADASAHWAAPPAAVVARRLNMTYPAELNAPITPGDWNRLVAGAMGQTPGKSTFEADPVRYWVWTYTGNMARDGRLAREDAFGGLMKLMNYLYKFDVNQDFRNQLERFKDGQTVSDHQRPLVAAALAVGFAKGYPDGTLRPAAPLTYGEAAVVVERLLNRLDFAAPSDPFAKLGEPRGFGEGLTPALAFKPDEVLHVTAGKSGAGNVLTIIHGAAAASALPGIGTAPPGHTWVMLDVQINNTSTLYDLSLTRHLRWGLEDPPQLLYRYELDWAATAALGSPFADTAAALTPGGMVRGVVAFAVPVGTKDLWFSLESALGPAKDPNWPWNGAQRGGIGDLAGPEPVYPHGKADGSLYRVQGVYADKAVAQAVVEACRSRGMPAWVEAEPDGQYGAVVFRDFEQ
ncbi:MAG TPA: S-layer homology domain-containing protein [Symbiobacteriaceae bacterium]